MSNKPNNFYEELKMLRVQSGVKAKDIALRFKKSPSWITKVEKGEIDISTELYEQIKSCYSTRINLINIDEKNKCIETIKFLSEENRKLRELLLIYIPTTEKDLDNILERRVNSK